MTDMTQPWLPTELDGPFGRPAALAAGVTDWGLARNGLHRPFHGVRARRSIRSVTDQVAAYASRLKTGQAYGGLTALRVWGIPTPGQWSVTDPVYLVVAQDAYRPQAAGVISRRLATHRLQIESVDDRPVLHPLSALCQVAGGWSIEDLLIGVDAVLTTSSRYPGLNPRRPQVSPDELVQQIQAWGPTCGIGRLKSAAELGRVGVDSPPETTLRLLMHQVGLPEPEVQVGVHLSSGRTRTPDLLDRPRRIAIEYEGQHHFKEADQWDEDVDRRAEFAADGWETVQVKASHLRASGRRAFIADLVATYRRRGWKGNAGLEG